MGAASGIDRLLTLACCRTFTVDEKIRTEDWWDVLLERWSDERAGARLGADAASL